MIEHLVKLYTKYSNLVNMLYILYGVGANKNKINIYKRKSWVDLKYFKRIEGRQSSMVDDNTYIYL